MVRSHCRFVGARFIAPFSFIAPSFPRPRRRGLALLPLALLWLSSPALCAAAPLDTTPVNEAAQDETGQVWAMNANIGETLSRWQGNGWHQFPFPAAQAAQPQAMTRGVDGSVYCLWAVNNAKRDLSLLSRHRGMTSQIVARFGGQLGYPQLLGDSSGGVWITGRGRRFWRVAPGGAAQSYDLAPTQYFPKLSPAALNPEYVPISAAEDSRRQVWLWANALTGYTGSACLRGVLIWNGKALTPHPTLPGLPDKPLSVIALKDPNHVWIASEEDGLYTADCRTFRCTRMTPPERGAFRYVERIFPVGADWYVLDWADHTPSGRWGNLWRLRGGHWQKLIAGVDKGTDYDQQPQRPMLMTSQGLWLGAFGGGYWWLPSGGKPVPVDWQRGFPLGHVQRILPLPDGRLLMVEFWTGALAVGPGLPPRLPAQPLEVVFTYHPLLQDSQGHLWGLLASDTDALSEWDGQRWIRHIEPPSRRDKHADYLAWDSLGRLWFVPDGVDDAAAVYNPRGSSWKLYPSYREALRDQIALPGFHLDKGEFIVPGGSPDGRLCFRSGYDLWYWDTRLWRHWNSEAINHTNSVLSDPPFFDPQGRLTINIFGSTSAWTEAGGWSAVPHEAGPADENNPPASILPPPGSVTAHPDTLLRDARGAYWMTWQRQLYKTAFGLSAPQFGRGRAHPFLDGRRLEDSVLDPGGRLWLHTSPNDYDEYIVFPAPAPLETQIAVTARATDSVTLRVTDKGFAPDRFVWRLDGGAWSAATQKGTVPLDFLPGGAHVFEAIGLDERLWYNPLPAKAAFLVQADPQAQIQALIHILKTGDDSAREAAVTHLLRFPSLAPPALQAARPSADEDARWWIDAAQQQIGDAAPKPNEKL